MSFLWSGKTREPVHPLPSKHRRPLQFHTITGNPNAVHVKYWYKFWGLPNSTIIFHAWAWQINPVRLQHFLCSWKWVGFLSYRENIRPLLFVNFAKWVRCRSVSVNQRRATKMFGAPLLWGTSERAVIVQSGEEKPLERPYWGLSVIKRGLWERWGQTS